MLYRMQSLFTAIVLLVFALSPANAQDTPLENPELTLLSAYFGLDNALPLGAVRLCRGANEEDGMPVIFSTEIDPYTLEAEDFAVITASGAVKTPICATLSPAVDEGELRTVLLIGEMGEDGGDAPARVEIVGEILSLEDSSMNFLGASVEVTPLSAGPSIIVAESVPLEHWNLDQRSDRQQGNGCPSEGTMQVIRVTWAGGISNSEGDEAGDVERAVYSVTVRLPDGTETAVTPFELAELGDGDNNHFLCLDVRGVPVSVYFPAGYLLDPNEDTLNPETTAMVQVDPDDAPMMVRNVRYCEVASTYRSGRTLVTQIWNTLGLNDCPAEAWEALDAETLKAELGVLNVGLNGPRYWVLDEIAALGGVTSSGRRATFGTIDMELRAELETNLRGDLVGSSFYTTNTVERDTRYVFYAGNYIYTLTDPDGNSYVMQSYAQIIDPEQTIEDLLTLGERLTLPEGWVYEAILLEEDFVLLSGGQTTIVQDNLVNTYQRTNSPLPGRSS